MSEDSGKLVAIAGDGQKSALRDTIRGLQANLEYVIEAQQYQAKVLRAKYLALVKSGFTEAQALEICKASQ